jgi:hypothetical protein
VHCVCYGGLNLRVVGDVAYIGGTPTSSGEGFGGRYACLGMVDALKHDSTIGPMLYHTVGGICVWISYV